MESTGCIRFEVQQFPNRKRFTVRAAEEKFNVELIPSKITLEFEWVEQQGLPPGMLGLYRTAVMITQRKPRQNAWATKGKP
jgi:hypothetical protein